MQIESKRFLLTGGVSMIGTRTAELLLEQGAREVILFDNLSFDAPDATVRRYAQRDACNWSRVTCSMPPR